MTSLCEFRRRRAERKLADAIEWHQRWIEPPGIGPCVGFAAWDRSMRKIERLTRKVTRLRTKSAHLGYLKVGGGSGV